MLANTILKKNLDHSHFLDIIKIKLAEGAQVAWVSIDEFFSFYFTENDTVYFYLLEQK